MFSKTIKECSKNFHKKNFLFSIFKTDKTYGRFNQSEIKFSFLNIFKRFEPTKKVLMI